MTAVTSFVEVNGLKVTSGREVTQLFATDIAAERTRMLYQGSQVPTLLMLLSGVACTFLLWGALPPLLLSGLVALAGDPCRAASGASAGL